MNSVSSKPERNQARLPHWWNRPVLFRWLAAGILAVLIILSSLSAASGIIEIRREKQVRSWVESIGGFCRSDGIPGKEHWLKGILESPSLTLIAIESGSPYIDRKKLKLLSGLRHLSEVHLEVSDLIDDDLKELSRCRNLKVLDVSRSSIVGTGFDHLSGMANLKEIHLRECRLNRPDLKSLANLPALVKIDLGGAVLVGEESVPLEDLFPGATVIPPDPLSGQLSE